MKLTELNDRLREGNEPIFMADMPDDIYRQCIGIAQSDLKLIKDKSLYHFKNRATHQRKETDALILGRAIHKAIFEWEDFDKDYVTRPKDLNARTKVGKEELAKLAEGGKTILKREDMATIKRLRTSLMRKSDIKDLVTGCQFEKVSFVRHNERIVKKIKTDGWNPTRKCIVDVKTCLDASPRAFMRDIFKYGYHFQDAYYVDVIDEITGCTPDFYIIALEKSFPFEAAIYQLSPKSLAIGRKQYMEEMEKLDEAIKTNTWPSYTRYNQVSPPAWLEKEAFGDIE